MRATLFVFLLFGLLASVFARQHSDVPDEVDKEHMRKANLDKRFMAKMEKDENVVKLPSGLMYKEIVAGTGDPPLPDDIVTIHYQGSLVEGLVFDSTYRRKKPMVMPAHKFPVSGFKQGIQLMTEGSTFEFYMPYNLGFGDGSVAHIINPIVHPKAVLKYKAELLKIERSSKEGHEEL